MVNIEKILLHTFSAIGQYLQELFSGAIKPLQQIITDLIEGLVKPVNIFFATALNFIFSLKFLKDRYNFLA
jgi:hypothetical protein